MCTKSLEVILTHEHTDFDALASLLGAALLHPQAIPVLPRRLNRNVHSFLALYKNHFPFITHKDLPQGKVERAILVDARAVNWVRGMDNKTELQIIDHHTDPDESLPPNATLHSEPVGANTTLLVELLMRTPAGAAAPVKLSAVQATLLALGIHEDTGSLTYPSTTHRDARCLAWLMETERGVNLEVLGRFLNHPLSDAQRNLLETLIEQSEFHKIAGHTVVLSHARATGFSDELSALVGRLRNHHEADAIFMVVELDDIVQMVARSLTDDIDVGKVARALGGGGHTRAAAAPIDTTSQTKSDTESHANGNAAQAQSLHSIVEHILAEVKRNTRPAITVAQIMSIGRPQTLPPDLAVEEAAALMSRYGHEGFPVIQQADTGEEKILGVLTRREADRAINHKMGEQPVSRFMRAGNVSISAQASIHELRRLMTESNWGQIPVVDENDHILGIVTRTDLIKLWDETALPTSHAQAIAQKLESVLNPQDVALLRLLGIEVEKLHFSVYIVGGFVRDLLLNHSTTPLSALDMDIVIEGDAIAFARRMESLYGGRVVPHRRFNTAKWILNDPQSPVDTARLYQDLGNQSAESSLPEHLDFISARTEFYTAPTALPTVEESSIKLDLHRRDFTINTLAISLNPPRWGELLDFYGGLRDLEEHVIRVLHSLSFVDDPTRILRAIRYEQRFSFQIEPRTLELLLDAVELLDRVTPARVRHELERILHEKTPEDALQRLDELGILRAIHPALRFDAKTAHTLAALRTVYADETARPELTAAPIDELNWGILALGLDHEEQSTLSERLGLQGTTQQLLHGLAKLRSKRETLSAADLRPSQIVEELDSIPPAALALAELLPDQEPGLRHLLGAYLDQWQHIHPDLNGHDLRAMGLPAGPIYRTILTTLRNRRLDGQIQSRDEEVELARHIADNPPATENNRNQVN